MTLKTLAVLLPLILIVGCSKPTEPEFDPIALARANLAATYTLSNGAMVPLRSYECFGPMRKAKNGFGYVKCQAVIEGYLHTEIHYCYTIRKGSCSETRPEE